MSYYLKLFDWALYTLPSSIPMSDIEGNTQPNDPAHPDYSSGAPTWIGEDFTFNGGVGYQILVDDDDGNFEDGYVETGGIQTLAQDVTINGTLYTAGSQVENEFSLIDGLGNEVWVLRIAGKNVGFVYQSGEEPTAGETFTPTGGRDGDPADSADGVASAEPYTTVDARDGTVSGSAGNDTIDASYTGDPQGDQVDDGWAGGAGTNDNLIEALDGNDSVAAGLGADTVYGGSGNDTIDGGSGNDSLFGGDDADQIDGGDGNDTVWGGTGGDNISGNAGTDYLHGETGDDIIWGGDGNDFAFGGDGADTLYGGQGADVLYGGNEADVLNGDDFSSVGGNDTLYGESGDDVLNGNAGDDLLVGGAGNDLFLVSDGNDTISDFNTGNTGALGDGDIFNNDFLSVGSYYDSLGELRADQADDGVLNQSNTVDDEGKAVDYSDNAQFGSGSMTVQGADASSYTYDNTGVVCFALNTMILTPRGEVPIESLSPGDMVTTLDNGPQPIAWIGQRHCNFEDLKRDETLRPVLIRKGVLGVQRDLLVSRQHAMLLGQNHFARAIHLAETMQGVRVAHGKREVTYFHLMFDAHQVIFAEGAPSESFYPGQMAMQMMSKDARSDLFRHFPRLMGCIEDADVQRAFGETARPFLAKAEISGLFTAA